ncbi:hypothetical protein Lbir_0518 [Legionella birminghamensis]|uniref:Nucleotidyl transferase of uncharacterized function (DUF1814) n=1 Tax=Legionella birminghamensis TaxID=28083 RepID=A0A378IEG0_9GAMM|nr:nucleotidyl transferase AbiEii/AbiGii toxin family protein [Legionella birminghamensis]KTC75373.1 hypothetical protein Lbir_0518 [Legionella birminghamensis]STX33142.1 Nucleotidyl transferase of uncharacterised function (DUF1814) [Legionella birminghamensis]
MNNFANLPESEKQAYYEFTADKKGLPEYIIEKDFWVCWSLKQLFLLSDIGENLIFKGGTSLSKAYQLIERFSEDIDISIDKKYLGFIEERDPEQVSSKKKQQALIKELAVECSEFVQNKLKNEIVSQFSKELKSVDVNWYIEIDPSDVDRQTLLFYYPTLSKPTTDSYIRPAVKIELGARGAGNPFNICNISPFIKEDITDANLTSSIEIKTLSAERTFWEKATILHMYANWPENKPLPLRQSRHFFDFYKLIKSNIKQIAARDLSLLENVVEHKKIYFRAGWANYDDARKGSLNLIPSSEMLKAFENDYRLMKEMFYGEPVSWDEIISQIKNFETEFNIL